MAKQLFAMPMRLLSVEAHPVIRVDLFNVLILSLAGQVGSVIAFVTTGRWKLQITHTQSVKNGSCQSGIWKAQRPTNVNAVSTGTVYTCGHQAGVTHTHTLAQGITATGPLGSTLVG